MKVGEFLLDLLSCAVSVYSTYYLYVVLLDPNREASKRAAKLKKDIAKRLGRPHIKTDSYEDVIACDVINPDDIKVKLDSIGGLETIKESLHELVILPLQRPELFLGDELLRPPKGVLLYGPPGTGKTMLAKAIAKESGAVFINVKLANLMSKWFGDAEKLVSAVFSLAHKLQPAIIFIDEVDSFLGQRHSGDDEHIRSMKTGFMESWDGFTTDQNARVMVLAATNRPSELDEAILRRLPQAFEIGLPDHKGRVNILKVFLKGKRVKRPIDFDHIAGLCDGYSGSDLHELCRQAAYFPIKDLLDAEKSGVKDLFGSEKSGVKDLFGAEKSGVYKDLFGAEKSDLFGAEKSGVKGLFGAEKSGVKGLFGAEKSGLYKDLFGAEKSGVKNLELRQLSQSDLEKVLATKRKTKDAVSEYNKLNSEASKEEQEASKKTLVAKEEIAKRFNRPRIETNSYEDVIACDVINPDQIEVEFDSIGGLESIKQSLHELVILPLRRPELFSHGKLLGPQKGVLLHGPPGTGKTMLAKAIAKESGAVFINVKIANLMGRFFGEAQKLVSAVFSLAHKLQPAIIFIDEVDGFLSKRDSSDQEVYTSMKTEFMALWDGFTTDQNARVLVLGATNRPTELDEAILRRFPQSFKIGLPDCKGRVEILKVILKGERVESSIDLDHIASLCDGYSGSDLHELCKKAAYFPIRDLLNAEKSGLKSPEPRLLSQTDLEKVVARKRTDDAASENCCSMYI